MPTHAVLCHCVNGYSLPLERFPYVKSHRFMPLGDANGYSMQLGRFPSVKCNRPMQLCEVNRHSRPFQDSYVFDATVVCHYLMRMGARRTGT